MEVIATMNMFGKTVLFCNCDVCRGFLGLPNMGDAPVVVGTIRTDSADPWENGPSAEDLANITD